MSDASEPADSAEPTVERGQSPAADTRLPAAARTAEYLQWGALAVLVLFALVAAVSLYTSVGRIIDIWVAREFVRPRVLRASPRLARRRLYGESRRKLTFRAGGMSNHH